MRHRARTFLTVLGLAVSTALLYDMALLSRGLKASLEAVLADVGYELRVLPVGSLPFSSEAALSGGRRLAAALDSLPGVAHAAPLWATTVYLARDRGAPVAAVAHGLDPGGPTLYRLERGTAAGLVVNARVADSLRVEVGDTLLVGPELDLAGGGLARAERRVVTGVARVRFDLAAQRTVVLPLAELQELCGRSADDPASFILGKLEPGAPAEPILRAFGERHPEADVYSVDELLAQVRGQLSYFQQFSRILGTVSLLVTFLLILTLLTLSVNERQGEFAILRALGLPARRVVALVLVEGLALTLLAIAPGLAIGGLASFGLDAILRSSPGLPPDLSFFVFTPAALVSTIALVLVTGTLAGAYPAFVASRTDVVRTLHQEVT